MLRYLFRIRFLSMKTIYPDRLNSISHKYAICRRDSTPVQLLGNVFVSYSPVGIYTGQSWL